MNLRIALADDEPIARTRLRMMLSQIGGNTIIAECRNGRELISTMASHALDLVLTDIEMPGLDGFQVMSRTKGSEEPLVAFTTAHPQYASRAFDDCALDYLVKPIEIERLAECLRRARKALLVRHKDNFPEENDIAESKSWKRRFFVADGIKHIFVGVDEIDWIEAADYYACLHVGKRSYFVRQTIQHLSKTLDPARFVRTHRSAIVNLNRVQYMMRNGRRGGYVVLIDQSRVQVSNSCWTRLINENARKG